MTEIAVLKLSKTKARPTVTRVTLIALLLLFAGISLGLGSYQLPLKDVLSIMIFGGELIPEIIIFDHRLPRIIVAIGCGMAFGIAGSLFQTMLKNPLASPDWIGFTSGASFGALLAIYFTGSHIISGAVGGVIVTSLIVLFFAFDKGINIKKLLVVGIGVNVTLAAGSDLLLARADDMTAADMSKWLVGSLNGRDLADAQLIWGGLIALSPILLFLDFPLRRLMLADDIALSLGINIQLVRLVSALTGIILVTLAVCVAGPLPFVAFVAAPIAKRLEGGTSPALFSSAMMGGIIILIADLISRNTPLVQLPTGVFTALIGVPILIWLLIAQTKKGQMI